MNHPVANSKNSTNSLMGWSPPPDGILKINTDGAFVKETGVGAWGFIIRDSAGHAVIAGAGKAGSDGGGLGLHDGRGSCFYE
jgi:hypothetical protein